MKQKTIIILLAVLALVLIAAAVFLWIGVINGGRPAYQNEKPQTAAPDITVYTAGGEAVRLSDFQGKPVVLNFWASWCGPCKSEMPAFEAAYRSVGDQVQFLMVNLTDGTSETVQSASTFIADTGYTFPVFFDTAYAANITYGVSSIPSTFFIDADGNMIASHVGAMDESTLRSYLDQIV